ncbi:ATP-binding protein [Bacillus sp. 165]|uniref:two-component system histidine kinase PnpS n=1 Tax=Bacillus sp. 165 TaxID=1529117 RepID=UPI001ADD3AE2|nr:ATP-binding protein [Bacillus sp. 165]MBO9130606.1 PAS domain-containing protein [Bacillus sp. 165]
MNKFRSRLLFALISLIITVLIGLGLLLGQLFKGFYTDTLDKRIENELKLVSSLIEETRISKTEQPQRLRDIEEDLKVKFTLLDERERIVYDSNGIEGKAEQTEQIQQLLQQMKNDGDKVHVVDTNSGKHYYGIVIGSKGNEKEYLITSLSVESLMNINQKIWGLLIGSLGIAFIVIVFLGIKIAAQYTKPIESVTAVAIELAKGNYKARAYEDHVDETRMLSEAINVLARNLQRMTSAQEMQQDRLHTLIENMGSGMILIDSRGYINLVNRSFKETFHVNNDEYLDQLYYEAFQHTQIIELVEEIFMTEVKVRKQILLPVKIERKHFEVYGAPIIGTNHEWKGIVLVFHDITALKKLEQMRKDFLANVSHELKTPITSIKGFSETLLDGAMEDQKLREYFLSIILKESDRMQGLIQDLLELSKIEQQGFKLNIGEVDMKLLLEEVTVILQGKADDKQIQLDLQADEHIIISADAFRLKQIFINLMSNALSYTPVEGQVQVSLENQEKQICVTVRDTGIGISQEEIPRIFERFYRVDKARSRNTGGTGLGLSIVKHLVEAHNGRIKVKSTVGIGTTFIVILPKYQKNS